MKTRHSESLILMWRIGELEARHLKAPMIEPAHLLLGLCKSVDVDLTAVVPRDALDRDEVLEELLREVRRLRMIFGAAGFDARIFRRALRKHSAMERPESAGGKRLRRSEVAKSVFDKAGKLAEMTGSSVYPVHLLHALLSIEDALRDDLLAQQGVAPTRLKSAVQQEVDAPRVGDKPSLGRN